MLNVVFLDVVFHWINDGSPVIDPVVGCDVNVLPGQAAIGDRNAAFHFKRKINVKVIGSGIGQDVEQLVWMIWNNGIKLSFGDFKGGLHVHRSRDFQGIGTTVRSQFHFIRSTECQLKNPGSKSCIDRGVCLVNKTGSPCASIRAGYREGEINENRGRAGNRNQDGSGKALIVGRQEINSNDIVSRQRISCSRKLLLCIKTEPGGISRGQRQDDFPIQIEAGYDNITEPGSGQSAIHIDDKVCPGSGRIGRNQFVIIVRCAGRCHGDFNRISTLCPESEAEYHVADENGVLRIKGECRADGSGCEINDSIPSSGKVRLAKSQMIGTAWIRDLDVGRQVEVHFRTRASKHAEEPNIHGQVLHVLENIYPVNKIILHAKAEIAGRGRKGHRQ